MTHADDRDQPLKSDADTAAGEKPNPDDPKADLPFMASWRTYKLLGYSPIPLLPFDVIENGVRKSKVPWPKGWQIGAHSPASDEQCQQWERDKPASGVGLCCGFDRLVVIDIDTLDRALQEAIRGILPKTVWRRGDPAKGGAGFFRLSRSLETVPFKELTVDGQKAVEILWTGRQVATYPTRHPSGERYRFEGREGYPPDLSDLPDLTTEHFEALEALIAAVPGGEPARGFAGSSVAAAGEVVWSETDQIFDLIDDAEAERLGRELLARKLPAVIPLGERHEKLVALVLKLGDVGLSPERARDMLIEAGAHGRCSPPISEGDLRQTTAGLEFPGGRKTPIGVRRPEYRAKKRRKKAAAFLGVAEDEVAEGEVETYFAKYPELNEAFAVTAAARETPAGQGADPWRAALAELRGALAEPAQEVFERIEAGETAGLVDVLGGVGVLYSPPSICDAYTRRQVAVLAANPGGGKSLLTALEALAIAFERPDLIGETSIRRAGNVIVVSNEDGLTGFNLRLREIMRQTGLRPEERKWGIFVAPLRLSFISKNGKGVGVTPEGVQFVRWMAGVRRDRGTVAALILDTMASLQEGCDENSSSDMQPLFNALIDVAQAGHCAVMLVHHVRKVAKGVRITMADVRGSSAIAGSTRTCRILQPADDADKARNGWKPEEHIVVVEEGKLEGKHPARHMRIGVGESETLDPDTGEIEKTPVPWMTLARPDPSKARSPGVDPAVAFEILREAIEAGAVLTKGGSTNKESAQAASRLLREALDVDRKPAQAAVDALVAAGLLVVKQGRFGGRRGSKDGRFRVAVLALPDAPETGA